VLINYNILLTTHPHCSNQLVINPSLIVKKGEFDLLIKSLDDISSKGFIGLAKEYTKGNTKKVFAG
jgi:hypothetical protein